MSWQMHHGDCLEIMRSLQQVDHVITDPPYDFEAHTKQRRGLRATKPLSFSPQSALEREAAASNFARLSARWIVVFCQIESAMTWRGMLAAAGARYMRTGVWIKPDSMPQFTGDRPGMGFESIVFHYATKKKSRWNGGGRCAVFTHNKNSGGKHVHETQKPLPLMLELISLFTDPGDTILDPFAGSGTTGVACLRLGRNFIGIERDETYYKTACERLLAEEQLSTLDAARAGQEALFRSVKRA